MPSSGFRLFGNIVMQNGQAVSTPSLTAIEFSANKITAGTLDNARLPAAISVESLAGNLHASNLTGKISNDRLPNDIYVGNVAAGQFLFGNGHFITGVNAVGLTSGKLDNERLPSNISVSSVQANTITSDTIQTSEGLSFLTVQKGITGTGREDPDTLPARLDVARNMVVDGDLVQFNGTMTGNGAHVTGFAERQNASLEKRLAEYGNSTLRVYVSPDGVDTNHGKSADKALRTIRRACDLAVSGTTIYVMSGSYTERLPIYVKRNVAIIGDSLRTAYLYAEPGYERLDYFHCDASTYLYGLRFMNLRSPGFCAAFPCSLTSVNVSSTGQIASPNGNVQNVPVLYSPEGYYVDDQPATGPLAVWTTSSDGTQGTHSKVVVQSVTVQTPGTGYSLRTRVVFSAPTALVEGLGGFRAQGRVTQVNAAGGIVKVEVTVAGNGYDASNANIVSLIDDRGGSGAQAIAVFDVDTYKAWSVEDGTSLAAPMVFSKKFPIPKPLVAGPGVGWESSRVYKSRNGTLLAEDLYPGSASPRIILQAMSAPKKYIAYKLHATNLLRWTLQGSNNDGTSWTVLDERNLRVQALQETGRCGIQSPASYSYYALVMHENSEDRLLDSGKMRVGEIEFFLEDLPEIYVDPPNVQGTMVRSIEMTDAGSGYTLVPTVNIVEEAGDDAPSTPAIATATIGSGGRVTGIALTVTGGVKNAGRGYAGRAKVVIEAPSSGRQATAIAIMDDDYARMQAVSLDSETGRLQRIQIVHPGSGYTEQPTVSIRPPGRFRPIVSASPYVQNCSNITGPWARNTATGEVKLVPPTHPLPFDINNVYDDPDPSNTWVIDQEGSAGGIRIDGACPHPRSPLRSFVVDAFTQVNQGGIGFLLINKAYAQFVSTFGTFCSTHMKALSGSFANASNSVTDFGNKGLEARGYWQEPFTVARAIDPASLGREFSLASGHFVIGQGYRSDILSLEVENRGEGLLSTDVVVVEIDPPSDQQIPGLRTAYVDGGILDDSDGIRRIVRLPGSDIVDEGKIKDFVLKAISGIPAETVITGVSNGVGVNTKSLKGSGYKFPPNVSIRIERSNEVIPTDARAKSALSGVSSVRISILEGRKPDFLSIARINGQWYTVLNATEVLDTQDEEVPGVFDIFLQPSPPYVDENFTIEFHSPSYLSTGSHVMEYVGSGVTYNALPEYGGVPDPSSEIVMTPPAKVFYTTSDHLGNSKIGPLFSVDQASGKVTLDASDFDLANLSGIGPFKRNGVTVGKRLLEVSDSSALVSDATGAPDRQTVPTQKAVVDYVERRAVPPVLQGFDGYVLRADQASVGVQKYKWENISAADLNIEQIQLRTDVLTGMFVDGDSRVYGTSTTGGLQVTDPTRYYPLAQGSFSVHASEDGTSIIFRMLGQDGVLRQGQIPLSAV